MRMRNKAYEANVNASLKPCPFCGGQVIRMSMMDFLRYPGRDAKGTRFIGCTGKRCCVVSFTDCTEKEAVEAWNKRA